MTTKTGRGAYTRERVKLTIEHVKKAKAMVAQGKVVGRGHEFVDTASPGLVLRVTPQAATWYLRLRTTTVRIGAAEFMPIADIRTLASRARLAVKDGMDPRRDLKIFESAMQQDVDPAVAMDAAYPELADDQTDEERRLYGPWQWRDLLDEFLAAKAKKLDPDYFPQYEKYLRHPAFSRLHKRTVVSLDINDLDHVRDDLLEACVLSAAQRSVNQMKDAFTWAWKHKGRLSGLNKYDYPWWSRLTVEYSPDTREHTPAVDELARTLALAERHRTLGQTEHATSAGTMAMLWALVLTGQRTYALSRTETEAVVPWDNADREGWWAVGWGKDLTKSRLPHALPLPGEVKTIIDGILAPHIEKRGPSSWLFPSLRGDGPVSPNSVNQLLNRLGGVRNSGSKSAPLPDILADHGIRRWVPHDVRRALATYLADHDLGGAASAILDHSHDKGADERMKTAAVTRLHYDRAQRMRLKAQGMELWVEAVLEAYEREKAALDALPAPKPKARTPRRAKAA
ncbi:integrase family protein [Microvirga sp. 0TCS3.31]